MTMQRHKIVIIEDNYRQFQIIRDLLKGDYEIFPETTTAKEFMSLKSKLMRFLDNGKDTDFQNKLGNDINDVAAFIVDYDLKQDSDKTGILFCRLTECIANGSKPVLFLTICPDAEIENQIKRVETEKPEIACDNLRKPEFWGDESRPVESIVGDSKSSELRKDIIRMINRLVQKSTQEDKLVGDTSE